MSVRNTGTVNVAGAELTVNALDISKTGTVTVGTDAQTNAVSGTLRVNGALTIASAGTSGRLTLNNGTFETVASNVYKAATEGEDPFVLTDAWNKVAFGQYADVDLVLNDVGEYDLAAYQAVQNLLGDNKSKVNLVLNGTFKPAENATIGQMVGNAAANNTISVGETKEGTVTATLTGDVGVGALGVDAGTTTVKFTDNNTLSLAGQNGTVLSQNVETLEVAGTLALGILSTDTATVNAETVKAGTLEVNGDFAAQAVPGPSEDSGRRGAASGRRLHPSGRERSPRPQPRPHEGGPGAGGLHREGPRRARERRRGASPRGGADGGREARRADGGGLGDEDGVPPRTPGGVAAPAPQDPSRPRDPAPGRGPDLRIPRDGGLGPDA